MLVYNCSTRIFARQITVSNLFVFTQYIAESIDRTHQTDAIYLDFAKAFDTLDHNILCLKLKAFGLSASFVSLLRDYLNHRKFFGKCLRSQSRTHVITSGVPQGSVLGPLLFNDLSAKINSNPLLHADDTKIFNNIATLNDCRLIQNDLNKVLSQDLAIA